MKRKNQNDCEKRLAISLFIFTKNMILITRERNCKIGIENICRFAIPRAKQLYKKKIKTNTFAKNLYKFSA